MIGPFLPLLIGIVALFAILILGDLLAHPYRRELAAMGEKMISSRHFTESERSAIDLMLSASTSFLTGFLFILLPFFFLFDLVRGRVDKSQPPVETRGQIGRFVMLAIISVFAANPFAGLIWLPLYGLLVAVAAIGHVSSSGQLLRAFSRSIRLRRAVHL